jgi:hypothetical protein
VAGQILRVASRLGCRSCGKCSKLARYVIFILRQHTADLRCWRIPFRRRHISNGRKLPSSVFPEDRIVRTGSRQLNHQPSTIYAVLAAAKNGVNSA